MVGWWWLVETLAISKSNPFGRVVVGGIATTSLTTSFAVTLLYSAYTLLVIGMVFGFPNSRIVAFLSRNTLLVFLAHMPVRDWLTPIYYPWIPYGWWRQVANFLVLFVGIALVSETLRRSLRVARLRDWVALRLFYKVEANPT